MKTDEAGTGMFFNNIFFIFHNTYEATFVKSEKRQMKGNSNR